MLVNVADNDIKYPFLHILASVLAWASAVINPFIYAFKNRQYQQAFAKVKCRVPWKPTFLSQNHLRRTQFRVETCCENEMWKKNLNAFVIGGCWYICIFKHLNILYTTPSPHKKYK
jgi:hypothetical protein